jgi:hypothetical protein
LGYTGARWKQAREQIILSEPKSTGPFILPADEVTKGNIPLGLMQTSLLSRLSRMLQGRHIKDERQEKRLGYLSLDGSSYQTGDAAFIPATPQDLLRSRGNIDSQNSHNTQHARVKQNTRSFIQKGTQSSQACSGGHITPNPTQIDAVDASLLIGSIN